MPSTNIARKAKLTVTISNDVVTEIDEIVKEKGTPRSQIMEEMLRNWLNYSKRKEIEKNIEVYYLSLSKKEKKEDKEWLKITKESAKRIWND